MKTTTEEIRMQRKIIFGALLSIVVAVSAYAADCAADCEGADCTGGCDISSLTCSVSCIDDGCPDGVATCQEYGDNTQCYHSFSANCDPEGTTEDPPTGPEGSFLTAPPIVSAPDWAVLRYEAHYLTPVHRDEVHTLAASSGSFARGATDEMVQKSREQSEHRLSRSSAARDGKLPWVPPTERLHFVVSPNAPCSDLTMELKPATPAQPFREEASVFVRAAVDAEGKIVGAELLYSSTDEHQTRSMIQHLKDAGRIESTGNAGSAVEAFVVLFTKSGGEVGWILSGARRLI